MSAGSFNVILDEYNKASKTWSGNNNPKTDNSYAMTHFKMSGQLTTVYIIGQTQPMLSYTNVCSVAPKRAFANEELSAYGKLASVIRGHDFNASVFAGELHQLADLIVTNVTKVLTAYRYLRRGNWREACRVLGYFRKFHGRNGTFNANDLASFWLELRYGWQPLLTDIFEAQKAVKGMTSAQKLVFRTKSSSQTNPVVDSRGQKATVKNTVGLKATVFGSSSLANNVGLNNPASVAWEVMPWSFVVDWFLPVGAFLDSVSFLSGVDYKVLVSRFRISEFHGNNGSYNLTPTVYYSGGGYSYADIEFTRSSGVWPSVPLPSIRELEKALSLGHLQNAAALIKLQIKISR